MTEFEIQLNKWKKITKIGWIVLPCALLSSLIGGSFDLLFFAIIGWLGLFTAGTMIIMGYSECTRIKRSYCTVCGKKFDYEDGDISWEEVGDIESSGKDGISAILKSVVEFECTCENCGNSIRFSKKFEVARRDDKGNVKRKDLESEIRKYFSGK